LFLVHFDRNAMIVNHRLSSIKVEQAAMNQFNTSNANAQMLGDSIKNRGAITKHARCSGANLYNVFTDRFAWLVVMVSNETAGSLNQANRPTHTD
jgi:hypothetical protein